MEQICVFCMNLVNDYVCYTCDDYKGLMPLKEAESYLGEDFPEEYKQPMTIYGQRLIWNNWKEKNDSNPN